MPDVIYSHILAKTSVWSLPVILSLPPLPPPSPRKFHLSAYFVLSFPSAFPSLPGSAATWPTRSITHKTKDGLLKKEPRLAQQRGKDLVMWHLAGKSLFWEPALKSVRVFPSVSVSLDQAHGAHLDAVCSNVPALSHLLSGITFWRG